ncbi:asparagine synthase (glutamine-hydrolyzing) [Aestuariirhabdus sp. LZHN29]|uniref:asparagine synthase (glutamine-hydrolyzing) n=1 Tax=Aestuariirhabdus sp. LZHN29 TaxID=3417462 RepID=UPI003CF756E5
MCGITGYWDKQGVNVAVIEAMATQIEHRGPDDSGIWLDDSHTLALAHRRLSIIDLSPAGHQPMQSPCGRYVLVFNGEIYNHLELRSDLESEGGQYTWKGHSDTETLLASLRHWGVKAALQRLNGMFAFALWDNVEQALILARDRMGEKPLYYGNSSGVFLFGSELKALSAHPKWRGEIDREALTLYMRHNYVPTPWSIYKDIRKLPAANYLVIKDGGRVIADPECYWSLHSVAESGNQRLSYSVEEQTDQLDRILREAVRSRMASDVPLGAFLSGGFDSTTVAALMQAQSTKAVQTFTIGFHEKGYNEAVHAKAVAKHLGTDHTELYVTPSDAMAVIPRLPEIWDEPFSDASQIPTLLLSELTRKYVTVSLSGDGGDELFCGYDRYTKGYQIWRLMGWLPIAARRPMAALIEALPGASIETLMSFLPKRFRIPHFADRLPKLADVVKQTTGESYYHRLVSHWKDPASVVIGGHEPVTLFDTPDRMPNLSGLRERMMYLDSLTYLPDDILTKVDRASMAVSLEARVPLLDHRVVEFAWQVPMSMKYRDGKGKWLLREVLNRYVPNELMNRPKMGFGIPIEQWLCGPLRDWAEDLLSERRLEQEGFFDPKPIRKMWLEHTSGSRRWHYYLWDVLMFQAWLETRK